MSDENPMEEMMKIQARALLEQQALANEAKTIEAEGVAWDGYVCAYVRGVAPSLSRFVPDDAANFADVMLERRRRALGVDVKLPT